jgi:hypothetical protein
MPFELSSPPSLRLARPSRKPELDALRGLFLVWMTLTHLPTRMSDVVNQPFGFISSAEGFVFLSALLVGRVHLRQAAEHIGTLRARLWKRAFRVYGFHVALLVLAFTLAAAFAVISHKAALYNLLNFYIGHPAVAIIGSLLLIYCPPLLDILPMYVLFLLLSPFVFRAALRWGWKPVLGLSFAIWAAAQFGLRAAAHNLLVHVTHLPIPLQETGAFDLFAWQWVWVAGIWMGARSAENAIPLDRQPRWLIALSAAVCAFFVAVRHAWLGPALSPQAMGLLLDKWQIGALRMVNLTAFVCLFYSVRKYVGRIVSREPLITLGKAAMEVFCAHLVFVFAGLALLYQEMPQVHGIKAALLLVITFAGLLFVAGSASRKRSEAAAARAAAQAAAWSTQ